MVEEVRRRMRVLEMTTLNPERCRELVTELSGCADTGRKALIHWPIELLTEASAQLEAALAEIEALKADAARYRWLRDHQCNHLILSRDEDHASNYVTAKEWIEDFVPDDFSHTAPDILQRMKASNTIWRLQIYPNTPIGFDVIYSPTLDEAIDAVSQ